MELTGIMKGRNEKMNKFSKYILCGVSISMLNNLIYILSLYINRTKFLYDGFLLMSLLYTVLIIIKCLKSVVRVRKLFTAIITIYLSCLMTEIMIIATGITRCFYFQIYTDATELAIGEGIIMLQIYGVNFVGSITGFIISFVYILLRKKNLRKTRGRF